MSLQFTSIDEAFSPLSQKKRKEHRNTEDDTPPPQKHPGQVPIPPQMPPAQAPKSFADEIFSVQPYINILFMIVVVGMLYDIRQAALACKAHMAKQSA